MGNRRHARRVLVLSAGYVLLVVLLSLLAPYVTSYDPLVIDGSNTLAPPSLQHLFGTDEFGRDILTRLLYGGQPSIIVAVGATTLSLVLGVPLGLIAGYFTGWTEQLIMRFNDTLLTFPPILLAMVVVGFLKTGIVPLIITIGVLYASTFARLAYATTLQVKQNEYLLAAQAIGAGHLHRIRYCILPNITSALIVQVSLTVAAVILLESGLSFLGLGIVPPTPSWGLMIGAARSYMFQSPTYVIFPALVVATVVLAVNTFGDALRDVLDPRSRS